MLEELIWTAKSNAIRERISIRSKLMMVCFAAALLIGGGTGSLLVSEEYATVKYMIWLGSASTVGLIFVSALLLFAIEKLIYQLENLS